MPAPRRCARLPPPSVRVGTGSPDPRNDRICIMSSCPRQLVLPIYLLACLMPPATASAPYIFRRELELEEVVRQLADRLDHSREGRAEKKMILPQMDGIRQGNELGV